MGPAYVAITCLYAMGTLLLAGSGPESMPAHGTARASPWRDLTAGMTYLWNTPRLLAVMCIAFLINLCAFPLVTGLMPYVAKSVYGTDQAGFGYLVASLAFGALCGSLALTIAGERMRVERIMVVAMVAWYVMLVVFGQVHTMTVGMVCLFIIGVTQSASMVTLAVILLRTAAPQYRGRVMGVRMLAIYGNPVGLVAAGVLVERIGYAGTAIVYGTVGLVLTFIVLLRWRAAVLQAEAASA
jgi:predicted MFS family arabinose efflux permease